MLKIWGRRNSINVMKVLWACEEVGLEYERIDAGLQYGIVQEAPYRELNPNAKVPTIQDGGFVLWESNVIVRYLAAKHSLDEGQGGLYPAGLQARARAEQWMDWQQTTLHPDITYLFWGLVRNHPDHQDEEKVVAFARRLGESWRIVNQELATKPYLGGDHLGIADIPLGAAAWRWLNLAVERPRLEHVEAWHERLKTRVGFQNHVMLPLT